MEILSHENYDGEILYTVPQVAKIYKTSAQYVRNLIRSGALKAIRLGDVKVTHTEIHDFLARNQGMDLLDPFNIKPLNDESKVYDRSNDNGENT